MTEETYRIEKKYLVSHATYIKLQGWFSQFASPDLHSKKMTSYPVSTLYFDTPDYRYFRELADGHSKHHKFRIRAYSNGFYNSPDFFIEKKSRHRDYTKKIRAPFNKSDNILEPQFRQEQVLFPDSPSLKPVSLVFYEREALYFRRGAFDYKINFDKNIQSWKLPIHNSARKRMYKSVVFEIKTRDADYHKILPEFHYLDEGFSKFEFSHIGDQ